MCILKLLEMKQLSEQTGQNIFLGNHRQPEAAFFFFKVLKLLVQHSRNWWLPWVWERKTPCP